MIVRRMHDDVTRFGAETIRALARQLGRHLRDLGRDSAGAAAVVAALLFPVVVGGFGFGAETGYQYMLQRKLQHAADMAAHAAGAGLRAGETEDDIEAAALQVATKAGFPSRGTIIVSYPPGLPNTVNVVLTHSQARFFSSILVATPVALEARALAQVEGTGAAASCERELSSSEREAVAASGSTALQRSGCEVVPGSPASDAFEMSGSGSGRGRG